MKPGLAELLLTSCKQCHRLQHLSRMSRTVPLAVQRRQNSIDCRTNYHDVIIAGGGMVGNAMACALGSSDAFQDQNILVLEAAPQRMSRKYNNSTYDNRVFAITPGSKRIFQDIGAWEGVEARRYKPFQKMHVWDACGSGAISFDAKMVGEPDIAYIIEQSVLVESLTDRLLQLNNNVEVKFSTRMQDLNLPSQDYDTPINDLVSVTLDDGSVHHTKLIIGADGYNSFVRQKASFETVSYSDKKQSGVVATLDIQQVDENITAWQRFLPTGPIALLPLSESKSSLVWSTTNEHAQRLVGLSEDEFVTAINNAFRDKSEQQSMGSWASDLLDNLTTTIAPGSLAGNQLQSAPSVVGADIETRAMFPLGMQHVPLYAKPRVVLIGDAAHRIHPMAGQGVNLGFGDVQALSRVLKECLAIGGDMGSLDHLLHYETERQRKVLPVIAAISGLNVLFSTTSSPMVFARSAGMQAFNSLSPIKNQIISFAMG